MFLCVSLVVLKLSVNQTGPEVRDLPVTELEVCARCPRKKALCFFYFACASVIDRSVSGLPSSVFKSEVLNPSKVHKWA